MVPPRVRLKANKENINQQKQIDMAKKRTVTKTSSAAGDRSRVVTRTKKDGSTVTKSRRVTKSPTGKSVTKSVTRQTPKTKDSGYAETTKSTTRKKMKAGDTKLKSTVKKTSTVRPDHTGGASMGRMAAREEVRGQNSTRSKVVTRKKGVGRSVNRTASSNRTRR